MFMIVRVPGTLVAFHPCARAVCVVFFFPDGDGCLDRVNDGPASSESGVAVSCRHSHTHGDFANLQVTGAVNAPCRDNFMLCADFCKDALTLFLCEFRIGFILQRAHLPTLVMIANAPFKTGKATGGRVTHCVTKCSRINGLVG